MTAIIASARVHGRNLELIDSPIDLGLFENEELLSYLRKKGINCRENGWRMKWRRTNREFH